MPPQAVLREDNWWDFFNRYYKLSALGIGILQPVGWCNQVANAGHELSHSYFLLIITAKNQHRLKRWYIFIQNILEWRSTLQNNNDNTFGYMRLPQVLAVFPVSKSTWWEGVRIQRYPQPVKIAPRITAWRKQDILKLLSNPENSCFK